MEINNQEPTNQPRKSPNGGSQRRNPGSVSSCCTRMNERTFSNFWSVENFPVQLELHTPGEFMLAPKFGDSEYEFVMKLFPNGKDEETAGYISLFLLINKCPNPRLRFRVSFTVETADGPRSCHLNKNLVTINRSGIVTASKFFSLELIKSASQVYIPNNIMTIGVELTIFGESLTWSTNLFTPYSKRTNASQRSIPSSPGCSSVKQDDSNDVSVRDDGFNELLSTGDFSDFTVVSSCGREFATHMCVLSARSDYFKALLRNKSTKEYTTKRVVFEDVSGTVLDLLLRHIYSSGGGDHEERLEEHHLTPELISAVDRLMITSMRAEIDELLNQNVTAENVTSRMSMSAELRLDDTYAALLEYFASHKKECIKTQAWREMRCEQPALTIKILEDAIQMYDEPSGLDRRIIDRITLA